jgi:hypothetical protein
MSSFATLLAMFASIGGSSGGGGKSQTPSRNDDDDAIDLVPRNAVGGSAGSPVGGGTLRFTLGNSSVAENSAGAAIGKLTGVNAAKGASLTYSVSDSRFEVVGSTLRLKSGVQLNHETQPNIDLTIRAVDGSGASGARSVRVAVTNVNEAPVNLTLSGSTVSENVTGAVVGRVSATDPDNGDTLRYSVSDSRFEVSGGMLRLRSGVSLDHETTPTVDMTLRATDRAGLSVERGVRVTVNDVAETTPSFTLSRTTVSENAPGAVIGQLNAVNVPQGTTLNYSVSDSRFEVVNGALRLRSGVSLDYEAQPNLDLTVRATGSQGLSIERSVRLSVTNVNEAPTNLTLSASTVAENAAGAVVGRVAATDPDSGSTLTYSVSDSRFEVSGGMLRLRSGVSLNYETTPTVDMTLRATDAQGLSVERSVRVSVTNVNEAPTNLTLSASTVAENAAGAVIGRVTATDPDAGSTLTYSVSDSRFEIVNGDLKLRSGVSLNYESTPTVDLTLRATDAQGLSVDRSVRVSVTDVAEGGTGPTTPTPPVQGDGEAVGADLNALVNPTSVYSGRVSTIAPQGTDVSSIRILDRPDYGHLSINPDNTLSLVMTDSDYTGRLTFSYETTSSTGATAVRNVSLNVQQDPQVLGWATGENHYMLETDAEGDLVIEHGDNHRKVFVSGSGDALTRAEIAAMEGVSVNTITGEWLAANPEYGGSEGMALAQDAGSLLWNTIAGRGAADNSHHLLLERGYTYDDIGRLVGRGTDGESELNPMVIGAYGEGARPIIPDETYIYQDASENVVITGLHFTGGVIVLDNQKNFIFDDLLITQGDFVVQGASGITFRNSSVYDVVREDPANGLSDWDDAGANRISGMYAASTEGLLLDGLFFDHNGWEDGYDYNLSGDDGQPPSMFSHNMYLQASNSDVTLSNSILMRGASFGVNFRPGGFVVDNLLLDNNAAITVLGGNYLDAGPTKNYTLMLGNVITSAGHLKVSSAEGATTWGIHNDASLTSFVDNILAHLADPNNPAENLAKSTRQYGLNFDQAPYYDDTIQYNWGAHPNASTPVANLPIWDDRNVEGLDTDVLDETTIQIFTAELLGRETATIADLANYLRAQANGAFDDVVDADLINAFFQAGFGLTTDLRTEAETVRFVPDQAADGVRWDNRLNWDTGDLPGSVAGDSVDLGGNRVVYSGTTTIEDLHFGDRGGLSLTHGRLTVEDDMTVGDEGATLDIAEAGQFWTEGFDGGGRLDITQTGGRFVNTGDFQGQTQLTASGGQTILAADDATFALTSGSRLTITGGSGEVGFDGEDGGLAILGLGDDSTLAFRAASGQLGTIEEFRSGAFGDAPDVKSGVDLGNAGLQVDLTGISGTGQSFTLIQVDELIGSLQASSFTGLGSRNAQVMIDYAADTVTLTLSSGTGAVNVRTTGTESTVSSGHQDLWNALTAGRGTWDDAAPGTDDDDEDDLADAA